MAHTSFTEQQQKILLSVAREAIQQRLATGKAVAISPDTFEPALQAVRASFVTLMLKGNLRGCIGTLIASQSVISDVAYHAQAAAFHDPRFPPVTNNEFSLLDIHISVLNPAEPLIFNSEAMLLQQLRPHIDGLIFEVAGHKATFLPSVWESLPTPDVFLRQLKQKAGLPADFWSDSVKAQRYTVESIG
ncbi:AmmeMemoRadiSam system protein A [Beggiatoa leptomitoformis]|uniref:AmmeMemoRadiSam system protein A n=1 Tax=Beggiatoa leptomitoformis TaxID=288004 RepID=A0A2N9YCH4_9GAMM|nr:AmmeMemoRadiSam system protein A [Beggiatoa leptomitoformis]ALG66533.1 AmmeMemoRadiSam system protein A [Beggiatoa leptomitoformis]AUI68171.1 AmmeMemoRadiSam system protein A [Beggiatoa leptomitoformis]